MGIPPFQELLYTETIILITLYTSCSKFTAHLFFSHFTNVNMSMCKKISFLKLIFLLLVTQKV